MLAAVVCIFGALHITADPAKPNVIVIIADDLGYADIGVQGVVRDIRSPNIDSIAKNGVRFTNGYVTAPVCSPSRAGFLTGRYQERYGHELNPIGAVESRVEFGLPLDQVTIADEMKRVGYVTGLMGKWHEGHAEQFRPLHRGFDEFFGFLGGAHSYTQLGRGENALRRQDEPVQEKEYLTDAISREAVAFIEKHKAEPFFLEVAYNAVHTPQQSPDKYLERFADVKDKKRKLMLAMLAAEDDGVGEILSDVRANNLEENTLIVFFSDNGGPTGANGSRNKPLRGYKGQIFEGGIRIPFMMQWKGKIESGQVKEEPVISVDVLPTALAVSGATPREGLKLDGVNLLPWLEGKSTDKPHETLYWRFGEQWAIRDGNHKLLHTTAGGTQLFDLSTDLSEKDDLSKSMPDIAKKLQAKYDAWAKQLHKPLWPGKHEGQYQGEKEEKNSPNGSKPTDD